MDVSSVKSKSASFIEYAHDSDADLIALTETWLTVDDTGASLEIVPNGYKLINHPQGKCKGGNIARLHRDNISVMNIKHVEKCSFAISELSTKFESFSMKLVIIYHSPYSTNHPVTVRTFVMEFTAYLETIIMSADENPNDVYAVELLDTLESMGPMQHVDVPTHEQGHTRDLVITLTIGPFYSDYAAVFCWLNSAKPHASARLTTYRKLKSIDLDALKCDIVNSALCTDKMTDLNELAGCYNSTLSSLIDPLH